MHTPPLLLVALGSGVPVVTDADMHVDPTDDRHGTLIATCTLAPTASPAQVHDTVLPATEQVAPLVAVVDGGGPVNRLDVADSAMFWLSLGPTLVTVILNVAVPLPGFPVVDAVWVMRRSARRRTVPQVADELSAR
jgi:hypothetical protein